MENETSPSIVADAGAGDVAQLVGREHPPSTVGCDESKPPHRWRDVIKVHPAAELFPKISAAELSDLGADIKAHGLKAPVTLMRPRDGGEIQLLDGRNRLDAMELVGLPILGEDRSLAVLQVVIDESGDFDPFAFVVSANIRRRHLDNKQKRELIAELLKQTPGRSDSAIAKVAHVDHKTVAPVRATLAAKREIPHSAERTEADGKKARGRKPSATPKTPASQARAKAISSFATLLQGNLLETLDDLGRMLSDQSSKIETIPAEKRIALARRYIDALGIDPADLGSTR
jgi:ParB-like chromosome segregation protein Spo0J